ncbi:MAG: hypothetical protein R3C01_09750 [Planctomycetaceae bacterium]
MRWLNKEGNNAGEISHGICTTSSVQVSKPRLAVILSVTETCRRRKLSHLYAAIQALFTHQPAPKLLTNHKPV